MTVLEQLARDLGRVMAEWRKALLKVFHRMRGLPEFVEFCQRTERKARRRAKYYRRIRFKTMERHRRGKK